MPACRRMGEKCKLCDSCSFDYGTDKYFCNLLDSYVENDCWCENFVNHISEYLDIDLMSLDDDYINLCYQDGWN